LATCEGARETPNLRVDIGAAETDVPQRALVEPAELGAQAKFRVYRREAVEQAACRRAE
jgi:hypothetical protein